MEFCVLGLLMIQDMTIYDLNKTFAASLSLFYSASLGSLQTAIKKLIAANRIASTEILSGKRRKKVYRILESGRQAFFEEMYGEIPRSKLETISLARTFFLGLLPDRQDRIRVLNLIIDTIREELTGLRNMQADLQTVDISGPDQEMFQWQLRTLDYGVMSHEAGLRWFERALAKATA